MRGFLSWIGGIRRSRRKGKGGWWEERCAADYDCSAGESVFPGHDAEFGGE